MKRQTSNLLVVLAPIIFCLGLSFYAEAARLLTDDGQNKAGNVECQRKMEQTLRLCKSLSTEECQRHMTITTSGCSGVHPAATLNDGICSRVLDPSATECDESLCQLNCQSQSGGTGTCQPRLHQPPVCVCDYPC